MPSPTETIGEIVDRVFSELRPRLIAELEALQPKREPDDMVNQHTSGRGTRRTINACRSVMARGGEGAYRAGRIYWISRAVLDAELASMNRARAVAPSNDPVAELKTKLAAFQGGQR